MRNLRILLVLIGAVASAGMTQKMCATGIKNSTDSPVKILYQDYANGQILMTEFIQPDTEMSVRPAQIHMLGAYALERGSIRHLCDPVRGKYCTTSKGPGVAVYRGVDGRDCVFTCS